MQGPGLPESRILTILGARHVACLMHGWWTAPGRFHASGLGNRYQGRGKTYATLVQQRRNDVMSRILTAAVGLTLLFIATEARAAVYHVRNAVGANCSDSGAGSSAQPYCTVQACLNKVKSVSPSA